MKKIDAEVNGKNACESPTGVSGINAAECKDAKGALPPHGGDIYGALAAGGPEPLDFSANISPLGLPEGVRRSLAEQADGFTRYPDPHCRKLRATLSERHGMPKELIVCGAGSADLIFRAARTLRPKRVLVTAPAFSEYERAAEEAGAAVSHYPLASPGFAITEAMCEAVTGMDLVFLCNPNNPTGLLTPRDTIIKILHACGKAGAILIVDECFMDLTDEPEAFTAEPLLASHENLMILKAFTKTYAMAGLRLGYALCGSASIAERIAGAGPPWSVSAPAQTAGISALKEAAYLKALREIIKKERGRLKEGLAALGAEVLGGSANYVFFRVGAPSAAGRGTSLAEAGRGASLAEAGRGTSFAAALTARGILIRDCSNFKGLEDGTYFRAAVRLPEENDAFLQAVKKEIRASGQQKKKFKTIFEQI